MKVLVTGGAGFIGSHVVEMLVENKNIDIGVLDNLSSGKKENLDLNKVAFYEGDINDYTTVESVIQDFKPQSVIHLAAQINVTASIEDPLHDGQTNIVGTLNLLEAARTKSVNKIVFASSAAVYGNPSYLPIDEKHKTNPLSPYGLSKYTVEKYLELYADMFNINYTVLRYSNVYGPRQDAHGEGGVVAIFNDLIKHGKQIEIHGDGTQSRDFVFVKDVAQANYQALTHGDNMTLNVSSNGSTTVNDLVELFKKYSQNEIRGVNHTEPRPGDIEHSVLNNTEAKSVLKWEPAYTLDNGIQKLISND
ncbi:NAD-dependent epimerase/dehydratase family protein [Pontibacillus salipaludis]|uniref:UDP-glucose 4-epimerase n=1 Tax=Pontibacillus salipaludis TaxID=1697394 RepID=A0ABQ1QI24_9BACI|nr:GDP-mannose 4,6-dehydratase [Pontibacillus salipaludis]GGD28478.1 UDP-glucose 4-epimerase [Pontibacillus salipaludis]